MAKTIEKCLGCGCDVSKRDCGCPAGTFKVDERTPKKGKKPKKTGMSNFEIYAGLKVIALQKQLDEIASIIERVDLRCMAADGPVTKTQLEITTEEFREIYQLAKSHATPRCCKIHKDWPLQGPYCVQCILLERIKSYSQLLDAAMLIKRMAHRLQMGDDRDGVARQAKDWLKRKRLQGSPLREKG